MGKGRDLNNSLQECSNNPVKDSSNEGKINWSLWLSGRAISGIFSAITRKIMDSWWDF